MAAVSLSDLDIRQLARAIHQPVRVMEYPELKNVRRLEDLDLAHSSIVLLLVTSRPGEPTYGHWCLLFARPGGNHPSGEDGAVEFFNSYGAMPDSDLYADSPYLTRLLYESGLPISYNNYKFQRMAQDVNTCGRHCITRLLFRNLSLPQYRNLVCSRGDPDKFVVEVTNTLAPGLGQYLGR